MGGVSLVEFQGQVACLVGWRLLTPPPLLWPEERGKNEGPVTQGGGLADSTCALG